MCFCLISLLYRIFVLWASKSNPNMYLFIHKLYDIINLIVSFLLSCLLYATIGSILGFFVHIIDGIIAADIHFDAEFILKTTINFTKVLFVMSFTSLLCGALVLTIPTQFLESIQTDSKFMKDLIFYLLAFAAFDFGLKNS
jgi:hypothetical protein